MYLYDYMYDYILRFRGDNPEGMRSPARELGGDKPPMTGNGNHLSKW